MGIESSVREWAHRRGLQRSRVVVSLYRYGNLIRYRKVWDDPVAFRGGFFQVGRDLSLYPALRNGGFEAQEIDAFIPRVPEDAVVWDVGANVGIYTVLTSRAARRGHVIAFEPVPVTRQRLLGNIERNAVANVTVEPTALSDAAGMVRMVVHSEAHGCDQVVSAGDALVSANGAGEVIDVATQTGDAYAAASPHGDPGVIKIDVEGHEPAFFSGAREVVERAKPVIMMEVNPAAWSPNDITRWEDTLRWLFSVYGEGEWFDAHSRTPVSRVDVRSLGPHAYTLILPRAH